MLSPSDGIWQQREWERAFSSLLPPLLSPGRCGYLPGTGSDTVTDTAAGRGALAGWTHVLACH